MGKVFISYRRDDSAGYVRALVNELKRTFGDGLAFMDIESIGAGANFTLAIESALHASEVLLLVIGPKWSTVTDEQGRRRLEAPEDFVRQEILTALKLNVPMIPVLVEDTRMPGEDELPTGLEALAKLQALRLSHTRWENDIEWLIRAIDTVTEEPRLSRHYMDANNLARQGRWREAMALFEAIVARRPDFRDTADRLRPLRDLADLAARLGPGRSRWQRTARRFPLAAMLLAALPPNILAGLFNYIYNWWIIVRPMQQRGVIDAQSLFLESSMLVNGLGFTLGIAVFVRMARPVRTALNLLSHNDEVPSRNPLVTARDRCLRLGHWGALLGAGLWLAAGPFYPAMIGAMAFSDYAFFVASLFFCGLIASAYPFFGVTWLCARVLYPELVLPGSTMPSDLAALQRLERQTWIYLVLAGSLPMLAIAAGLVLNPLTVSKTNSVLLGVLGFGGFAGGLVVIWLFRTIQQDIGLLTELVRRSSAPE